MQMFHLNSGGGTLVRIYPGDITTVKADAVVNAGNTTLTNKQGLNKIILKGAGNAISDDLRRKINNRPGKELNFGDVVITGAGKLASKHIIHTVNAVFKNRADTNKSAVQTVIRVCLEKAKKEKYRTLAFPAIGTGLSHIRTVECIDAYVNALKSWKSPFPKEIHFVVHANTKLLDEIVATFTLNFPSTTPAPQSRNSKTSGSVAKTQTTGASSGSFPSNNTAVTSKPQSSRRKKVNSGTATSGVAPNPLTTGGASGGSLLQGKSSVTPKIKTNSRMTTRSGAMISEVTSSPTVTSDSRETNDSCPICLCDFTDQKTLDKCRHSFCSACIDHSFSVVGPYCPICQTVYGKVTGLQPPGTMTVREERRSLPGFPDCNLYNVLYQIPSGIQQKNHPNPGISFYGATRTAYLPANQEGETVLKMLQRAFVQKLIFTVGDSRTSNMSDVVTWNDIHHKTNFIGGPSRYGYPDEDYLKRVTLELEAKGITPADVVNEKIKLKISN